MPAKEARGLSRLFGGLRPEARARIATLLPASDVVELETGSVVAPSAFPNVAFLLVDEGFVVLRATFAGVARSVVTCEAGEGRLLRPPSPEEELLGLTESRLTVISANVWKRLLEVPFVAESVVEALTFTLAQEQEAITNFAAPHHLDRVRRRLLQLARSYGHVVRDGIRIDFPVSHAVLAEMIGSSRETVTRALDELQRTGFVMRSGSTYRLLLAPESVFGASRRL